MGDKQNNRKIGAKYERVAKEYLIEHGYQIVESNYFCKAGEIDIIAREGNYLVFVEVKYRKNKKAGSSLEAVDLRKQKTLSRCAIFYMMERHLSFECPMRFDVIGIEGKEILLRKNAFPYQGYSY